jgi:hypothetical protein
VKRTYRNGGCTYTHRRPYERYSYLALEQLFSHARPGSEEHEVIEREIRFRKKEPKQDASLCSSMGRSGKARRARGVYHLTVHRTDRPNAQRLPESSKC